MAKEKKQSAGSDLDPNAWMATFSDLLMLMLTFFVLLLTMSTLEQQRLAQLTGSGLTELEPTADVEIFEQTAEVDPNIISPPMIVPRPGTTHDLETRIESILRAASLLGHAWIETRPEGLVVNIDGQIAFHRDETRLTTRAQDFLRQLCDAVSPLEFNLAIEVFVAGGGHVIVRENRWDLALRRSDVVANFVIRRNINPKRIRVMGYGYAAGRDESSFIRHSDLLRFKILTGPEDAEPSL